MARFGDVMARVVLCCGVLAFGAMLGVADLERYDGHRVVRVQIQDEAQLDLALKLTNDVWSHGVGVGGTIDIRVNPVQFATLENSGLEFEVLIGDVQALADSIAPGIKAGAGPFDDYMPLADVIAYMNSLVALRPDLAQLVTVGTTVENRTITAIRITGPGGGTKPAVLYHGGIHAREWITVPTVLWAADQLIRNYDTDPYVRRLVDRCEFYLLPVLNADGYSYTWTNQRLWRKNRRNNGDGSFGVDLNRNFGHQWGGEGASTFPADETYRGPSAFSEPESRAIRDFVTARPNIVAYNDVHSYSQLLLWPWGYTDTLPADEAEFELIGFEMVDIIQQISGKIYTPGPIYTTIYPASGGTADWAYGARGIIGMSYELRDEGDFGFLLPPDEILPTAQEIFPTVLFHADMRSTAVRFSFPNGLPGLTAPDTPVSFDVRITPNDDVLNSSSPQVLVRTTPGGAFQGYPMTPLGGDLFRATIPGRACGSPSEFYVTAAGVSGGTSFSPLAAPVQFYSFPIGVLTESFRDNFETNLGWTVSDTAGLTTGTWVRVDPNGTTTGGQPAQPEDDNPAGTGTLCFVTGQGTPGGAAGSQDVDGGATTLTSPPLSLVGMSNPQLSYYRWMMSNNDDQMVIEVSADGSIWLPLETVGSIPAWTRTEFAVHALLPGATSVRVRFTVADSGVASLAEGAVDDVVVSDFACESAGLVGDMNCDGAVSVGDIAGFVLALTNPAGYSASFPTCNIQHADVNNDGGVTVGDIGGFVLLLTGG